MIKKDKSHQLFERAAQCLSGGVNSPVRAFKAVGDIPLFMQRGEGAFLFDIDGNRFLDFCCSWGPLILGHAHADIVRAVVETAARGTSFGTVHENEIRLAEMVKSLCPHIDLLRFVSSGTEAVMSAVRLARGWTGRDKIIKFSGCYHGHSDYLLASAGSGLATLGIPASAGVPADFTKHTLVAPLGDTDAVATLYHKYGSDIAAVLIEPVPANNGLLLQSDSFLRFLRAITEQYQSLLIFDEVISGFRVAPGGAAARFGITPDLCTYGKVIGGGLPVGAFGGKAGIMHHLAPEGKVYQAGTLSGNPLAMAAGLATLEHLTVNSGWDILEKKSEVFVTALGKALNRQPAGLVSIGSIFWISLQPETPMRPDQISPESAAAYARFFHEALEAGVYLAPSAYEVGFISTVHDDNDLNRAANKLGEIIRGIFSG